MKTFKTILDARKTIPIARYEMAFSDRDIFEIEGSEKKGYRIAMFNCAPFQNKTYTHGSFVAWY